MSLDESEIVNKYRSRVLYFCCKRLRDHSAAEEIAQEAMLVVLKAIREDRIHSPDRIGSYIFRVAENLVKKRSLRQNDSAQRDFPEQVPTLAAFPVIKGRPDSP